MWMYDNSDGAFTINDFTKQFNMRIRIHSEDLMGVGSTQDDFKLLMQTRITPEAGTGSAVTAVWHTHVKLP